METVDIMEYVCLVVTLLMFCTGIVPCSSMYKSGSTKNVPFEIFLLSVVSCSGMFHYGLLINNMTLAFLNGVGLFLQICYVAVYLMCVRSKSWPMTLILLSAVYLLGLYYYLFAVVVYEPEFSSTLGQSASLVTMFILCLPIFEVISNFRNKNCDGMPLVMLAGGTVCGASWLFYGMLLDDPNIYAPNIPGVIVNALKLSAVALYSGKAKRY
ncbi:hypothetical protein CAPTEDRAFT_226884 [Capitella teleta]|uniref:Sugar transporter SWEET1 n=1 Tax=Capitella teleta TaxID=283909 RepID=R7VAF1_CAPTE|nr:hypothetical protein CAPTEDRAFT_208094 [Capitella teleta]ELU15589.1 hypothetical protein CAPTEDRAFT_226884 [Capitella teleta]|eukprot:ELT96332.1 hypothetical protein CAPTEDRAFT_208094 [Capitella teleta]